MRTSVSYMFDGEDNISDVSLESAHPAQATIEFRGCDGRNIRRHYVRICGLSASECQKLAKRLLKAAKEINHNKNVNKKRL